LSRNDYRWALRRLADAGLGVLTWDVGQPKWEQSGLYFRSTTQLWDRWRLGHLLSPVPGAIAAAENHRRGGRTPDSDPAWFPTANSLLPSFTRNGRTDWKGLAQAVRKQLSDGGTQLKGRDEKTLTPGMLKSHFRNRSRRQSSQK
jgi:hypothetical protein